MTRVVAEVTEAPRSEAFHAQKWRARDTPARRERGEARAGGEEQERRVAKTVQRQHRGGSVCRANDDRRSAQARNPKQQKGSLDNQILF